MYVKILSTSLVTHGSRGHGGTQADVIALNPHFTGEICRKLCFHSEMDHIFSVHIMQEKLEIKATILDLCLS